MPVAGEMVTGETDVRHTADVNRSGRKISHGGGESNDPFDFGRDGWSKSRGLTFPAIHGQNELYYETLWRKMSE
jgi:hypothetical protein